MAITIENPEMASGLVGRRVTFEIGHKKPRTVTGVIKDIYLQREYIQGYFGSSSEVVPVHWRAEVKAEGSEAFNEIDTAVEYLTLFQREDQGAQ